VDKATLQPNAPAYMESDTVYAPLGGNERTAVTAAEVARVAARVEETANAARQAQIDGKFEEFYSKLPEDVKATFDMYTPPPSITTVDPTNSSDKDKIFNLLNAKSAQGTERATDANKAKAYFQKYRRPIDALWHIAADSKELKEKSRGKKEEETSKLLPNNDLSAGEIAFFKDTNRSRATAAARWINKHLSPEAKQRFAELQRLSDPKLEANKTQRRRRIENVKEELFSDVEEQVSAESYDAKTANRIIDTAVANALNKGSDAPVTIPTTRESGKFGTMAIPVGAKAPSVNRVIYDSPKRVGETGIDYAVRDYAERYGLDAAELRKDDDRVLKILEDYEYAAKFLSGTNRYRALQSVEENVHPSVYAALANGNMEAALRAIAVNTQQPSLADIAMRLSEVVGDVRVQILPEIDAAGQRVMGNYNPRENMISISSGFDITTETVLHEMVHAATLRELRLPSSPATRQLENLFADVKDKITANITNVEEFVSEALSNTELRRELAGIKVPDTPLTGLDRFMTILGNIVRRIMGRETKPLLTESPASSVVDALINRILTPAGRLTYDDLLPRLASTPQGVSRVMATLNSVQNAFPAPDGSFRQQFGRDGADFVASSGDVLKRTGLGLLPMQGVADIADHVGIQGAFDLQESIRSMESAAVRSDQQVDVVLRIMTNWLKKNKNRKTTFDKVVTNSTLDQADPSLTEAQAKTKYGKSPERLKAYYDMQKDWRFIGKDGQDLYALMRDTYKKQYEQLQKALQGKLDFILGNDNPELGVEFKQNLLAKLFDKGRIEPYFPLARKGDLWLEYNVFNPDTQTTEPVKETFQSRSARKAAMARLKDIEGIQLGQDGQPIMSVYNSVDIFEKSRTPDTMFIKNILDMVERQLKGTDPQTKNKVKAELTKMFIDALPESSFAKALQRRKGTKGFIEDSHEAFRSKAYSLGRQGVRYAYSNRVRRLADAIQEQIKQSADETKIAVVQELVARANYAVSPPINSIEQGLQAANRVAFAWTLGFNASSAVVNLSSIPIVVAPYLGGKYGFGKTATSLSAAYRLFANSGLTRNVDLPVEFQGRTTEKVKAMPSIDNYFVLNEDGTMRLRTDIPLSDAQKAELESLRPLIEMSSAQGQLNRSLFYDTLGAEDVGRSRGILDKLNAWSGAMFHQVERSNRQVSLVASYMLEMDRMNTNPTAAEQAMSLPEKQNKAAVSAIYQTTETTGGATLAMAPRFAQSGLGRIALMFKTYGIQMTYMQAKLAKQLVSSETDPAVRKAAFRQLAAINMSAAMFAGVGGMPIYSMVSMIWDMFLDDEEDDADMITRKYLGEGIFKGGVTAMTGADVSARIGLNDLLFRSNRYNQNPSDADTVAQLIGGPAWSTATQIKSGLTEFAGGVLGKEGDAVRGFENMMPASVRNVLKSTRFVAEGGSSKTRRGDAILDDMSAGQIAAQIFGFAPAELSRQQDINSTLSRIDKGLSTERTRVLRKYYAAIRFADSEGRQDALAAIRRYNEKVTSRGFPKGVISPDTIEKSVAQNQRTTAKMHNGITLSPMFRDQLVQHQKEINQGFRLFDK
jgi:hypothetical protein